MNSKNILLDIDSEIATVFFNRPASLNSLSTELLKEFRGVLKELSANDAVKVIILTGAGDKAFVAGADLQEVSEMKPGGAEQYSNLGHECLFYLEKMEKLVIAAVNGFALGGGTEIALACDFIFASENATFGQPEVVLGLIPGFGGTQRLPRAVGVRMARELIYTGERMNVEKALECRLVNRVFPLETLLDETKKVAKKIISNSFSAVIACKKAINTGSEIDLYHGCEFEKKAFALTFDHRDFKEGITAFIEKRSPKFS